MAKPGQLLFDFAKKNDIKQDYEIQHQLGSGKFSVVKLGVARVGVQTGLKVAIKEINKAGCPAQLLVKEVQIMRLVSNHPGIIKLYDLYEDAVNVYLVLELVTGGELFDKIVSTDVYSEKMAADYIRQVIEVVAFLHDKKVVHRDLKPENLLLEDASGKRLKVCDFGLAEILKHEGERLDMIVGSPNYMGTPPSLPLLSSSPLLILGLAPEVLANTGYGKEVDMYSIGVILYTLLCGYLPIEPDAGITVLEFPSPDWDAISDEVKELIEILLDKNPSKRPTARHMLQHPWVKGEKVSDTILTGTIRKLGNFTTMQKKAGVVKGNVFNLFSIGPHGPHHHAISSPAANAGPIPSASLPSVSAAIKSPTPAPVVTTKPAHSASVPPATTASPSSASKDSSSGSKDRENRSDRDREHRSDRDKDREHRSPHTHGHSHREDRDKPRDRDHRSDRDREHRSDRDKDREHRSERDKDRDRHRDGSGGRDKARSDRGREHRSDRDREDRSDRDKGRNTDRGREHRSDRDKDRDRSDRDRPRTDDKTRHQRRASVSTSKPPVSSSSSTLRGSGSPAGNSRTFGDPLRTTTATSTASDVPPPMLTIPGSEPQLLPAARPRGDSRSGDSRNGTRESRDSRDKARSKRYSEKPRRPRDGESADRPRREHESSAHRRSASRERTTDKEERPTTRPRSSTTSQVGSAHLSPPPPRTRNGSDSSNSSASNPDTQDRQSMATSGHTRTARSRDKSPISNGSGSSRGSNHRSRDDRAKSDPRRSERSRDRDNKDNDRQRRPSTRTPAPLVPSPSPTPPPLLPVPPTISSALPDI